MTQLWAQRSPAAFTGIACCRRAVEDFMRSDLATRLNVGSTRGPIRVVIANDISLVRLGLASSLSDCEGLQLEGVASHGREALWLCEKHQPDVLITGIRLSRLHGVDLARLLADSVPNCGVVGLLRVSEPGLIWRCLEAGIDGLLCQESPVEELVEAMIQVVLGRVCLSPSVQTSLVRQAIRGGGHLKGLRMDTLTAREREVAQLMIEGLTNEEIGRDLHVSSKTIDSHRHHLLQKLGCRNVADLTRLAFQEGMIRIER